MTRHLVRFLPLCIVALTLAGAGPALAGPEGAECCKVTYNAAKTHVQVTGTVAYKGDPIRFLFYGNCTAPAGKGLASVKSRWIPLKEILAGWHHIDIVQRVNGKIVYTQSPKFFIKGALRIAKPTLDITSGPQGQVSGTSALFKFKSANRKRLECRLDNGKWKDCSYGWAQYLNLRPGPHTFTVRAYALDGFSGKPWIEEKRSFVLNAPLP